MESDLLWAQSLMINTLMQNKLLDLLRQLDELDDMQKQNMAQEFITSYSMGKFFESMANMKNGESRIAPNKISCLYQSWVGRTSQTWKFLWNIERCGMNVSKTLQQRGMPLYEWKMETVWKLMAYGYSWRMCFACALSEGDRGIQILFKLFYFHYPIYEWCWLQRKLYPSKSERKHAGKLLQRRNTRAGCRWMKALKKRCTVMYGMKEKSELIAAWH